MSTSIKREILGLSATISNIPTTVEEGDQNAKKVGAVLEGFIDYNLFHGTYGDIRAAFLARVEEVTKIKRQTKPGNLKKDGTAGKEVYDEKESAYFFRVCAEKEVEPSFFQPQMDEVCEGYTDANGQSIPAIVFDASSSRGERGPGKIAAVYMIAAKAVIEKCEGHLAKIHKVITKLKHLNPGLVLDVQTEGEDVDAAQVGWPTVENLARAIKADEDRKRAQTVASLME